MNKEEALRLVGTGYTCDWCGKELTFSVVATENHLWLVMPEAHMAISENTPNFCSSCHYGVERVTTPEEYDELAASRTKGELIAVLRERSKRADPWDKRWRY